MTVLSATARYSSGVLERVLTAGTLPSFHASPCHPVITCGRCRGPSFLVAVQLGGGGHDWADVHVSQSGQSEIRS